MSITYPYRFPRKITLDDSIEFNTLKYTIELNWPNNSLILDNKNIYIIAKNDEGFWQCEWVKCFLDGVIAGIKQCLPVDDFWAVVSHIEESPY